MMNTPTTPLFDPDSPYRQLARKLDSLPNRFPPAGNESDLRLLAKLFTPDEAALAACLYADPQSPSQIATRLGRDAQEITAQLKDMSKKGLIAVGKTPEGRPGFGLMPFVVGIYEMQVASMDTELAAFSKIIFKAPLAGFSKPSRRSTASSRLVSASRILSRFSHLKVS
jgi:hypothetical protein